MHGKGTFVDPRLANRNQFPVVERSHFDNKRDEPDLTTSKLASLHFYQIAIPPPVPPNPPRSRNGSSPLNNTE